MSPALEILTSHGFQVTAFNLSIICIAFSIGVALVAMVFYGRAREPMPSDPDAARWQMLFATWRDSLVITLLYVSEGIMWRAADFQGMLQVFPQHIWTTVSFVQPIAGLIVYVLIFTVAALRIIALTRWLRAMVLSDQS